MALQHRHRRHVLQRPGAAAAAVVGARDPVGTIDAIWDSGGDRGRQAVDQGAACDSGFGFYFAGAVVWCLIGLLCVYAMFLIALSSIALSVLLALGPLFIAMLLFDAHARDCSTPGWRSWRTTR